MSNTKKMTHKNKVTKWELNNKRYRSNSAIGRKIIYADTREYFRLINESSKTCKRVTNMVTQPMNDIQKECRIIVIVR